MNWLLEHAPEFILGGLGAWQAYQARKRKRAAQRLQAELDFIRAAAGTKAPWEGGLPLSEAGKLRDRAKKSP